MAHRTARGCHQLVEEVRRLYVAHGVDKETWRQRARHAEVRAERAEAETTALRRELEGRPHPFSVLLH